MRNLLEFFIKHSVWFVFTLFVIISCVLLFKNNPYQQSVYLTSANSISATIYEGMNQVTSYFYLRDINEDLQHRNAALEMEVVALRNQVNDYKMALPDSVKVPSALNNYDFIVAHVISNSISLPLNYITINRGANDGVKPEMGVVDQNGIVGIVNVVGAHSARIISLLNPNLRLSCKVKGSDNFGSLVWDGKSPYYAVLEEMPRHVRFHKGDTIVTSGYSSVFPEGITVGTIDSKANSVNDNFYSLKIKLSTDFTQLSTVRTIKNNLKEELEMIKKEDNPEGGKEGQKP